MAATPKPTDATQPSDPVVASAAVPATAVVATETVEEYRKRQQAEYGTYVALGPITIDGALAFTKGHAVPESHVKRFKYLTEDGLVAKRGSKAATDAGIIDTTEA